MDLEKIVNTYGDMMYKLASAQLSGACRNDAFDVVQDVFLKLHVKPLVVKTPDHLKAWLIRAVINRCRDYDRASRRRESISFTEFAENEAGGFCDDRDSRELQELIDSLEPKYRAVLYLHYYEGYKIAEISKMLGVGESGIKKRLVKAREKLKDYLQEE
ncbi:MAG: RNA polymerase sigma factor [Oscillospiraceae bacterium]|nr:RNA polymerase sigma factor [Oscillospiraceae bacterium]